MHGHFCKKNMMKISLGIGAVILGESCYKPMETIHPVSEAPAEITGNIERAQEEIEPQYSLLRTIVATQRLEKSHDISWNSPYAVVDIYSKQNGDNKYRLEYRHGSSPFVKSQTSLNERCDLLIFRIQGEEEIQEKYFMDVKCNGDVERADLYCFLYSDPKDTKDFSAEGKKIVADQYEEALKTFLLVEE